MKKLFFALLCCGLLPINLSNSASAANANAANFLTLADEQATLQLCQKSADTFNQQLDIKSLTDVLRPYFPLPEKLEITDNFETKQTLNLVKSLAGNKVATVYIDSKKFAKDSFIQYRFLLKRENSALFYQCTFYKPVSKWQLFNYHFSDDPTIFNE